MPAVPEKLIKKNVIPVKPVLYFHGVNLILIPVLWFLPWIRVDIILCAGLANIVFYIVFMNIFLSRVFKKSDSDSFVGSALEFMLIQPSVFFAFYMFIMAEHLIRTAAS